MGQEFTINSPSIESTINDLLPSQGGYGAGIDFSASTMIIPIIDVTPSASGDTLRQDLQTSIDLNVTAFDISNATNTTIIATTGYYRIFGNAASTEANLSAAVQLNLTDGTTTKVIFTANTLGVFSSVGLAPNVPFDFVVKISAGDTLRGTAANTSVRITGLAKQIADINGNLT
jgi:hypothetical protein